MPIPLEVIDQIREKTSHAASPAMQALIATIMSHYGEAVQAVLYYGSCLREGDELDGIVDLYVLVDTYRSAYPGRLLPAVFNKILPPNVFYLEIPFEGGTVRTKYAIFSVTDFQRGASRRWFHSYVWGRFAQPAGLLYARTPEVEDRVINALAQAAVTFITRVLPRVADRFSARQLWCRGLLLSYRTELRAERPDKVARLYDASSEHYDQITRAALAGVGYPVEMEPDLKPVSYRARIPLRVRWYSRFTWAVRSLQGKLFSILRLFKAWFTFRGGMDYILWKVERHSGVTVEVTPRLRRFPLLAVFVLSWRLYRRGAFR
jgi:hypothetical protein